jgi:hypothetical protein
VLRFGVESEAIYQRENLLHYTRIVVFSNHAELQALDEFAEEMAVPLMDNWSSQVTSEMRDFLISGRFRLITFASCTTQIFQIFDVTLFYGLKGHPRYELPFGVEEVTVRFLMNICHGFKQITVDSDR